MNEKKEKFIIFALAGILLLIVCFPAKPKSGTAAGDIGTSKETRQTETAAKETDTEDASFLAAGEYGGYAKELERELEELLGCMENVGRVKVMVTLRSSGEEIVEKDRPATRSNIAENDSQGGVRNTNELDAQESTVFVTDGDGNKVPFVRMKMQPAIGGVAVMAEGGGDENVRRNISEAIQALFDIDANKIKIAKMKMTK